MEKESQKIKEKSAHNLEEVEEGKEDTKNINFNVMHIKAKS